MSFNTLCQALPAPADSRRLEEYYDGKVRLDALGVTLPPQVRVLEMVAPWPRMAVDVLAEVLTFVGFALGKDDVTADPRIERVRRIFQINDMDTTIRLGITEALVQGSAYFIVGPGDPEPRITVHRRGDVAIERDFMGRPVEAVVRWRANSSRYGRRLSHYTPGRIDIYVSSPSGWVLDENATIFNDLDEIPVVPFINKARIGDVNGRSEMIDVLKTADAGSRSLTNLQVAQELMAMPQRWIFANGVLDKMKEQGKTLAEVYMGYLQVGPEGGDVKQLPGASLDQIINSYKLYAQIISSITGIPPSMLGISTDNPASAEAMRVAKDRLSTRGEVKQSMFGDPLEDLARITLKTANESTEGLDELETVWRDVATPSKSAQQSMALQAFQSGAISAATMRDFLDLTPAQRQREDKRETALIGTGRVAIDTLRTRSSDNQDPRNIPPAGQQDTEDNPAG